MKHETAPPDSRTIAGENRALRICLVDDDLAAGDALSLLLRINGFSVKTYGSAEAFLKDPGIDAYACILLDMHMPTMSGLELLELLRSRKNRVPVIMMTGLPQNAVSGRLAKAGPTAVLEKPVSEEDLLATVRRACAKAQ